MNLHKDVIYISDREIIEGKGIVDCHSKHYTIKLKGRIYNIVFYLRRYDMCNMCNNMCEVRKVDGTIRKKCTYDLDGTGVNGFHTCSNDTSRKESDITCTSVMDVPHEA